ncbi:hypothetical protein D3C86_1986040 [compost metagenome]
MLINDLLNVLTVGWIVNETVLINKHHAWLVSFTSGCKFGNIMYIIDVSFFDPSTCKIPG